MKRLSLSVCLLVAAASVSWAQPGKNPGVDKVRAAYEKAVTAGSVADMTALYTADAVVMPPDMPMSKGKPAIEAYFKKTFETVAFSNVKITPMMNESPSADVAIESGTYSQMITPKGGKAMNDTGKYLVVLKRQGDAWKLAYEIYNGDKPMAMPPPPTAPKK